MSDDPGRDPGRDRVAAYHEAFATHTDPARRVGWRGARDHALRLAVCCEALDVATLESVLDVGCGLGALNPTLRRRGFQGRYVGVDLLPSMIDGARAREPDATFIAADIVDQGALAAAGLDPTERFDLVVACGTLSLRVPDYEVHVARLVEAMWRRTAGALVIVAPSGRGRRHHLVSGFSGDDPFAYHSGEALRRRVAPHTGFTTVREDFLPTDVAVYAYRGLSPTHEALLRCGEVDAVGVGWLLLERKLPARALAVLEDADDSDPETWLRRGQALRRLGRHDEARAALVRCLELDAGCTEANLELEGL